MRMLIIASTDVSSSDGPLLLMKALDSEGISVSLIPVHADLPFWAEVGYSGGFRYDPVYISVFNRHVLRRASRWRPDVVFLYGSNWCLWPQTIRKLQVRFGCKVILWELNQLLWRGHQSESIPLYDHVFVLDSYLVPVLKVAGAKRVDHLCACADPVEHSRQPLCCREKDYYEAEICFVGSVHPDRVEMLRNLTHRKLRVYGRGWEDVDPELARCVRAEPVYGVKKSKIYSASKISLNVHGPHMISGENFRVFEVAACGGVSFSTFKPDLTTCFDSQQEVVIFENGDDLRAKVDHYLSHPDELNDVAEAGHRRVLAEHTYQHRARTIVNRVQSFIP